MPQLLLIHPSHPQERLVRQVVGWISSGGVVAIPTDSGYALVCHLDDKAANDTLRRMRGLSPDHPLSLLCENLQSLGHYAQVSNAQFRLIKSATPGPYTFILSATHEVPKRLSHPKRKTIGLRVPNHPITQAILAAHGEPLLTTSCELNKRDDTTTPLDEAWMIQEYFGKELAGIVDGGQCAFAPTTVIDLSQDEPIIVREGQGDLTRIGL